MHAATKTRCRKINQNKYNLLAFGLPWWLSGKESAFQFRRCKFYRWVGMIPWGREWQPIPVFLPGESRGQKSLVDYSPLDGKTVGYNWVTKQQKVAFDTEKKRCGRTDTKQALVLQRHQRLSFFLSPVFLPRCLGRPKPYCLYGMQRVATHSASSLPCSCPSRSLETPFVWICWGHMTTLHQRL